ncbi:VOC family protein [Runella sp.]|uniref:VOC family protein n=1 Tax=Runella sp. TaxID=1960881 RepID=UPI003D13AC2F
MHIDHLAIWCHDLERMRSFYELYFGAVSNEKYINEKKKFESYFLSFEEGPRLEIMQMVNIPAHANDVYAQFTGLTHFAVSVGSEESVDQLTELLRSDGYEVVGEPRRTGDGYYESVVFDPEQNRIEITA